jgi:3,4-dihydroxy 2-butanone 4-phosphate synthase/GTP cyclohydrolase II
MSNHHRTSSYHDLLRSLQPVFEHLRSGGAVILRDSDDREAEGDLAFAARHATPALVNECLHVARGLLCVALAEPDADRIGVTRLPTNGRDPFATPFGTPINFADGSSGISAAARARTLRAASDPACGADRFVIPGHVHTLLAHPGRLNARTGHTEAIVDLLRLAGIEGPGALCEILNERGEIAGQEELTALSASRGFPIVHIDSLLALMTASEAVPPQ